MTNRRQFLAAAAGSSLVALSPGAPDFLLQAARGALRKEDETILVVLQLTGGNDGLNTVIPYADDAYHRARHSLAFDANGVLKIDDYLGFHPALAGMEKLYQSQRLAIVQGVGYPHPNRSHFESMDIWHSARADAAQQSTGWLGRYFDAVAHPQAQPTPGFYFGAGEQPLALRGREVAVPALSSLVDLRLPAAVGPALQSTLEENAAVKREGGDLLDFLQRSAETSLSVSRRIEAAAKGYRTDTAYPQTALANRLKAIAQLIDSGLSARVYYTALDGFDTHSQQAEAHRNLLSQWGDALLAFLNDLAAHGHGQRVLVAAFSEFGRRVKENGSLGTDHGAAAPMFIAGESVQAGLHGKHPSLTDLTDGDLKYHTDFRQVYATLLENWLSVDSGPLLGNKYEKLELVKA